MITDMPGYDPDIPVLRRSCVTLRRAEPTVAEEMDALISSMEVGRAYWPETLARDIGRSPVWVGRMLNRAVRLGRDDVEILRMKRDGGAMKYVRVRRW